MNLLEIPSWVGRTSLTLIELAGESTVGCRIYAQLDRSFITHARDIVLERR